ncbi:MAG: DNA-binding protein [Alphaproteobacteria bacterium]|nr:DNA-binding protein [Alphaproteobacteria bacterium]
MSIRSSTIAVAAAPRLALCINDAAAAVGVSRATLYVLMADGRLPFVKLGKRRLVRTADLHAMLDGLAASPEARA